MKRYLFILCLSALSMISYSQTIIYDKKDPFTDTRKIATGLNALYRVAFTNILSVCSELDARKDSIVDYRLDFSVPYMQTVINNKDTLLNTCLLIDEAGSIYNGTLKSETSGVVIEKAYQSYTCSFSKEDFYKLMSVNITNVKITTDTGKGGLYPVDKKQQDNIARQGKTLLNQWKEK